MVRRRNEIPNQQSKIRNHKFTRRLGVTLMEVLIAAGVTAVGLFGVLALIPVAGIQVQRGITEDRKAVLGKNAIAAFHIYGMRRPAAWHYADGTAAYDPLFPQTPFCIDPRFASVRGEGFPYRQAIDLPGINWMPRVSIWNYGVTAAHRQLADELFQAQDDLEFTIPTGNQRTLPAFQSMTTGDTKRQSVGQFSWFATVVPKHGTVNDEWVLSVVVLQNRDRDMSITIPAAGMTTKDLAAIPERVYTSVSLTSGGVNGGEVQIGAPNAYELDGISNNSWVMLAGSTNSGPPDFKWYRIIGVDTVTGTGPYYRTLTLQGADWQRFEWFNGTPTQATIVAGVVGVFERTIRLETTGLWTQ